MLVCIATYKCTFTATLLKTLVVISNFQMHNNNALWHTLAINVFFYHCYQTALADAGGCCVDLLLLSPKGQIPKLVTIMRGSRHSAWRPWRTYSLCRTSTPRPWRDVRRQWRKLTSTSEYNSVSCGPHTSWESVGFSRRARGRGGRDSLLQHSEMRVLRAICCVCSRAFN